jgi:glycogen phosphorylase
MLHAGQAHIHTFRVVPSLPKALEPLHDLAHNLWWTWRPEAVELFRRLDRDLWRRTGHNPVQMLTLIDQGKLERAAADPTYITALQRATESLQGHLNKPGWFDRDFPELAGATGDHPFRIAYFCAEFGLTECFQIYSGGLGVLAGDHLKSASELGLPLVGVGLLYRHGYFHQYVSADGWQQETYPEIDPATHPVRRVLDRKNRQKSVTVRVADRDVELGIWRADVGRVPLYLLDANMASNHPDDREITRNLYGGDVETRIRQEVVLGIGGVRALEAVGENITVFHMNEGHSAFLALERIRRFRETHGVSFEEARQAARPQHVFTTHTPVPAGIDRFSPPLVEKYFAKDIDALGIDLEHLLALGRENVFDKNEFFSMAVLALRTSAFHNGVSKLHGVVSRHMWRRIWPQTPVDDVPIGHVTNGVHTRTWISPELRELYDRYLGWAWQDDPADHTVWKDVHEIPDDELWRTHVGKRRELVSWARRKVRRQLRDRGARQEEVRAVDDLLDPEALTIGFARRFATYKRATLLLRDRERLHRLLSNQQRPVQFLIAGKSHPADGPGKELIREIVRWADESGQRDRILFLEDYDMHVGRRLVQGCDVWLNTPRRGMEASGTSGMKAAMNGGLNVSILDGWWDEAYESDLGFAIGRGETYADSEQADAIESRALFDLLERQIIPEFFTRDRAGIPRAWVQRMKKAIASLTPFFNTNRMVGDYTRNYYVPAWQAGKRLTADRLERGRQLAAQVGRWRDHWPSVVVQSLSVDAKEAHPIRAEVGATARVALGGLAPDEIAVQLYHGREASSGDLVEAAAAPMRHVRELEPGLHEFAGAFTPTSAGRCGVSVRVLPASDNLVNPFIPGLITWFAHEAPEGRAADESRPQTASAGA